MALPQVLSLLRGECLQLVNPPGCGHLGGLSVAGCGVEGVRLLLIDSSKQKLHVWASHGAAAVPACDGGARGDEADKLVAEEAAALDHEQAEAEVALQAMLDEEWARHEEERQSPGAARSGAATMPVADGQGGWMRRGTGYIDLGHGVYREHVFSRPLL